ncbi:hypothetical protein C8R45DRAFT_1027869, partial [Mycena sanguinolenta]
MVYTLIRSHLITGTQYLVRLFELVHSILVWHGIYSITVTFYGQPEHLADPPPTLALTLISETIIVAVVQIYFINRIRLVSKKWFLPALCLILTLFRFGACVAMLAVVLIYVNLFILSERFRWLMCASLGSGTAVDVLVTAALCYYLWQARVSPIRKTRRIADKLIAWSIESTAVKSAAGIIELILFLTRDDLSWTTFYLIQSALFSNSMLVSLNSRQRASSDDTTIIEFSSNGVRGADATGSNGIQISKITETHGQGTDGSLSK